MVERLFESQEVGVSKAPEGAKFKWPVSSVVERLYDMEDVGSSILSPATNASIAQW